MGLEEVCVYGQARRADMVLERLDRIDSGKDIGRYEQIQTTGHLVSEPCRKSNCPEDSRCSSLARSVSIHAWVEHSAVDCGSHSPPILQSPGPTYQPDCSARMVRRIDQVRWRLRRNGD